eukprot:scaffold105140_cov39-Tisochrysis_lutea.AAC.3
MYAPEARVVGVERHVAAVGLITEERRLAGDVSEVGLLRLQTETASVHRERVRGVQGRTRTWPSVTRGRLRCTRCCRMSRPNQTSWCAACAAAARPRPRGGARGSHRRLLRHATAATGPSLPR